MLINTETKMSSNIDNVDKMKEFSFLLKLTKFHI